MGRFILMKADAFAKRLRHPKKAEADTEEAKAKALEGCLVFFNYAHKFFFSPARDGDF